MLRLIICLFLLIGAVNSFARQDLESRRNQIIKVIDEELKEVSRLSTQYRHQNPRLLLRIAELFLEKARLLRDSENQKYLSIPPQDRRRIDKNKMFKGSINYFSRAQKVCERIIAKFKKFRYKADVYYILAFNAKEFKKISRAKKYFQLALKHARKGTKTYKKISLALAEIYYNEKNYSKAAPLYERGTKGQKDKWWTKEAFNLAWSYYRKRQFSRAINLMKEVYQESSNPKFVDMRSNVERDIGLFYIEANRFEEGLKFYRSLGKDMSKNLVQIGKVLIDRGKSAEAEKALTMAKTKLDGDAAVDLNLTLLGLYEKYGKYNKHMEIVNEVHEKMISRSIDKAQRDVYIYQLEKVGGILQKQVLSKAYVKNRGLQQSKARLAASYFEKLATIKNRGKNLYLKAETLYAAKLMKEANEAYEASFNFAKSERNSKAMKLSMEGMLASVAGMSRKDKNKDKLLIASYRAYLSYDGKSGKAQTIYKKLFATYFDAKQFESAENVLAAYKKVYPRDLKTQEAMVAKIMENYRKIGDQENFRRWVGKIKNKDYVVSAKYGRKLNDLLMAMQFESVEKATSKGDKKKALEGYIRIFNDKDTFPEAKKNAAHNITVLFFELGFADNTYEWANKTLALFDANDLAKFEDTYLAISSELFNMQRFKKASDLSTTLLERVCKQKSKHKTTFYKNAYLISLTYGDAIQAQKLIRFAKSCGVSWSVRREAFAEVAKFYTEKQQWDQLDVYMNQLYRFDSLSGDLIYPLAKLIEAKQKSGDQAKANVLKSQMNRLYAAAKKNNVSIPVNGLYEVAKIKLAVMESRIKAFHQKDLRFPENEFNKVLEQKLEELTTIAAEADQVFSVQSGRGTIKAYQYLIETYQRFVREIESFNPPGKDQKYVQGFKQAMKQVTKPLLAKSIQYLRSARQLINSGRVLSPDNYWFIEKRRLPINPEYHFSSNGVLMDRRGRR